VVRTNWRGGLVARDLAEAISAPVAEREGRANAVLEAERARVRARAGTRVARATCGLLAALRLPRRAGRALGRCSAVRWRDIERMFPVEEVPDVWAGLAAVAREELTRRERERELDPLYGLSRDARVVLWALCLHSSNAILTCTGPLGESERLSALLDEASIDLRAGLDELVARRLVRLTWITDGDRWPPVPAAILLYRGEPPSVE
jgi:hypothetical protein